MSELSHYIKLRNSAIGCNAKQFECDKYLDCDSCLEDKIKEHDKQIRAKAINDYDNKLNEKINTDTRLKDTIRKILDNVAREMYCKGIDDFVNRMLEEGIIGLVQYAKINEIAKQLKAGDKE